MIVEMEVTLYHCVFPTKGRNVFFVLFFYWKVNAKKRYAHTEPCLFVCECMCVYDMCEYICESDSKWIYENEDVYVKPSMCMCDCECI